MATKRYVALLRGINVGGKNKVPMAELRDAFESHGFTAVRTYIQSGNVVFATDAPAKTLEAVIEKLLHEHFGMSLLVVVRSHQQFRSIVDKAPSGFGDHPQTYHSDVIFLRAPLTAKQAMRPVEVRDGVDEAWTGTGVLYFARLSARRTQSRMSKIVGTPEYAQMTIRSWASVIKILALLDEPPDA
jgi:uncharacterized protein (DUF1697 family)